MEPPPQHPRGTKADRAHSPFFSCFAEWTLPFFETLRGAEPFRWTKDCQRAFEELKQHLIQLPSLVSLKPKSDLLLYLVASSAAVSAVLIQEHNDGQRSVYYVLEALQGAKIR